MIKIFTSAEREVKDSRRSGMSAPKLLFWTRLGTQSLYVVGFIRLFDEVRAELVRVIFEFFDLLFIWFIILGRNSDCKSIYRKHVSNLG